ncbi:MAG: hypothetical protein ACI9X0_002379, partial [Kiritimatiellia bacterium]
HTGHIDKITLNHGSGCAITIEAKDIRTYEE